MMNPYVANLLYSKRIDEEKNEDILINLDAPKNKNKNKKLINDAEITLNKKKLINDIDVDVDVILNKKK